VAVEGVRVDCADTDAGPLLDDELHIDTVSVLVCTGLADVLRIVPNSSTTGGCEPRCWIFNLDALVDDAVLLRGLRLKKAGSGTTGTPPNATASRPARKKRPPSMSSFGWRCLRRRKRIGIQSEMDTGEDDPVI
jgi:hypothetical protein